MESPASPPKKYRVVVVKRSGSQQVVERDLPQGRAEEIRRALAEQTDLYQHVAVEEQSSGETPLRPKS